MPSEIGHKIKMLTIYTIILLWPENSGQFCKIEIINKRFNFFLRKNI